MNLICTVRSGQSNIKQVLKENLSISERLFKKVKHGIYLLMVLLTCLISLLNQMIWLLLI